MQGFFDSLIFSPQNPRCNDFFENFHKILIPCLESRAILSEFHVKDNVVSFIPCHEYATNSVSYIMLHSVSFIPCHLGTFCAPSTDCTLKTG